MAIKNIIGETFGRLTVLEKTDKKDNGGHLYYKCQCSCGNICEVTRGPLLAGRTRSCGCFKKEQLIKTKRIDLTNQVFGHLTVIECTEQHDKAGHLLWKCQCDCGNIVYINGSNLTTKNSTSCGCDRKSKGEKIISQILQKNDINFISQWDNDKQFRYDDTNYPIKFDFYLPEYNCVIEYDGIQHQTGWNNDLTNFQYVQNHDMIKNELCKNNNIYLIRIPYTDLDLLTEEYLLNKINNLQKELM